jgi:preprotein translocase subunit SecB
LEIVHPYVREIVHNLTSRMGLPPLVLDVKVPASMLNLGE